MTKISTVYLDLDRTLFRTERVGLIWDKLEELYPGTVVARRAIDELENFKIREPSGSHYDWTAHISSYNIDPAEAIAKLKRSGLADGQMEYEGVAELIEKIKLLNLTPKILTFGADFVQKELKIGLCPSLEGIEVITTLKHKGEYLTEQQNYAVLLDDRPIGDSLPPHVKFVQSAGYNTIPPLVNPGWPVVTSLEEFGKIIEAMVSDD